MTCSPEPKPPSVVTHWVCVYVFFVFFLSGWNLIYHYALLFFNGSWSSAKPTPTQSMSTGTPRSTTPASGARMRWPRCSTFLYTHTQTLCLYFSIISLLPLLVRDDHCNLFLWSSSAVVLRRTHYQYIICAHYIVWPLFLGPGSQWCPGVYVQ